MGIACLETCSACQRHVRCGERRCPFCGAEVEAFLRVGDYRLKSALGRSQLVRLSAALTAAGITVACEANVSPMYGIACSEPDCGASSAGTHAAGNGGKASDASGGASGDGDNGGASGDKAER